MVKYLEPIKIEVRQFEPLEGILMDIFRREIYWPLIEDAGFKKDDVLRNVNADEDDLIAAIKSGRIVFWRGQFKGKFNARISKAIRDIGGELDPKTGTFKLPFYKVTRKLADAITASEDRFNRTLQKISTRLNEIDPAKLAGNFRIEKYFDKAIWQTDNDINKTLQGITVQPKLTPSQIDHISTEYTTNLQKYIQNFTEKEIVNLREKVIKSTLEGSRFEGLMKGIRQSYGVSENKARFLARQETNLMMQELKKVRYVDAGSPGYDWACVAGSPNHPVRPDHLRLKGTFQKWDSPPVTNLKTGARNHPGCDYGCRCFAKVVVIF